jgi:cyclic-di-AMP phosphodiesterase PgpH
MGVFRELINRIYFGWTQRYRQLRSPKRRIARSLVRVVIRSTSRFNHRYGNWLNSVRRFVWVEGFYQALHKHKSEERSKSRRTVPFPWQRAHIPVTPKHRSTAQRLFTSSLRKATQEQPPAGDLPAKHHYPSIPTLTAWTGASPRRLWAITLLSVVLLSACFGQRFYDQPGLDVKSISPQTFYAPKDDLFEDKQATEQRRNSVRDGTVEVLKVDPQTTQQSTQVLSALLQQGRSLRSQAGSPPKLPIKTLAPATQDVLFQASDAQWQALWQLADNPKLGPAQLAALLPSTTPEPKTPNTAIGLEASLVNAVRVLPPDQATALRDLISHREQFSQNSEPKGTQTFAQLKQQLAYSRKQYRQSAIALAQSVSPTEQLIYNHRLFELSDSQWAQLEQEAQTVLSAMMAQGIHPGLPSDVLRQAIEAHLKAPTVATAQRPLPNSAGANAVPALPPKPVPSLQTSPTKDLANGPQKQLTADVIEMAIAPNLVVDETQTQLRAEQALQGIKPVLVSIHKGDLIVRQGEPIDAADFARLDHFNLTGRYFNGVGLCGFSLLIVGAIAFYLWIDHCQVRPLNQRDHLLVLLLCLGVSVLAALQVPTLGIPAVGLLVGSFYGSSLGLSVIGLLLLILPIGTPVSLIPLVAGAAAAMLGTWIAPQLRAREEFALLGVFVGLAQALVHLLLTLMQATDSTTLWKGVVVGSGLYGLYGIAWSVLALGVSPYLEHFFDVVTPIRLAELSSPNRPLLKRLAAEAPGTFQHTMLVATLAEAAARSLGHNVELVRAGTLYHDIGKMHDPQGFIENQMGGPNKHDAMADPWQSASLIKKHVTEGLVIARQYRLPKAVQAFIPEHQGDMKIGYFYQQAKERQAQKPSLVINEADFSYDGPIPQSPETGITMLADSCEAALRSLSPKVPIEEAYSMVDKILRARWRSRQLVDSGLSRDDMDKIATVFIQVWQQHNHQRISYPKTLP